MNEIAGKYALITGGAGGIGAATASVFAAEGASGIIIADLNKNQAEAKTDEIEKKTGCRCLPWAIDIADDEAIGNMFAYARESYGSLDILVNCAGICPVGDMDTIDSVRWEHTMKVNVGGSFFSAKEAFKLMKTRNSGAIVNVSSISGRIGGIATGIDYSTSKGPIISMTKALAKSGGPYGIRVNAVAPGFINTEMTKNFTHFDPKTVPMGRVGEPEDVADVILFLVSARSRYITGCTLDVTGGVYMG